VHCSCTVKMRHPSALNRTQRITAPILKPPPDSTKSHITTPIDTDPQTHKLQPTKPNQLTT